jgi:hypothetical protein
MEEMRIVYTFVDRKPEARDHLKVLGLNVLTVLKRAFVSTVMNIQIPYKAGSSLTS